MNIFNNVSIRPYRPSDRAQLRAIAYKTSFFEKPEEFFDDEEILADVLTRYFTDYEPESCFVAESQGKVVGYIIGTRNARRLNEYQMYHVFPRIAWKALRRNILKSEKNRGFVGHILRNLARGGFKISDFTKEYPAILHINIDKDFRGGRLGRRLLDCFFEYLRANQVKGVHAATMSEEAKDFFVGCGFHVLHSARRSYLRYRLDYDFNYHIVGYTL